jgi:hypothetical protein
MISNGILFKGGSRPRHKLGCTDTGTISGIGSEVHNFLKKLGYDKWRVRRLINIF